MAHLQQHGARIQAALYIGHGNQSLLIIGQKLGLSSPSNPAFDSSGNLWIPDFNNNRILEFACGDACSGSTSTTGTAQSLGQLQLFAFGAAVIVVGAAVGGVLVRRRGQKTSVNQTAVATA